MRTLTQHELTTVTGAGKSAGGAAALAAKVAAIKAALAQHGITIALDKTAGTLTITTPKGSKVITLPSCAPTETAAG
jgi:hypothetical protein